LINGTGGTRKSTTGDDGKYSFDSVTNNKYILTVAAANYFSQSDTIDVVTAAPVNANLKLIPIIYTSLKGTIVDSTNGKPVAGVLVTYAAPGGKQTKTVTTGSDGKYKFDSVTTGDLILTIGGYHLKVIGLTILKAGEKDVNVALTKTTGIIEGGRDIPEASPRAILTRRGTLRLCNLSGAGTLRLIDAGGRHVFLRRFSSSETQWDLPLKSAVASGRYTVTVTRKNSITRERITLR
jgi:5-hydroxyisourate hydrolase-like protein (transthyretin family)